MEESSHYSKSWFFKIFNLIKVHALTKRMFALIKNMGNERHMVLLVGIFFIEITIVAKC
jgi:hypothetical protein